MNGLLAGCLQLADCAIKSTDFGLTFGVLRRHDLGGVPNALGLPQALPRQRRGLVNIGGLEL